MKRMNVIARTYALCGMMDVMVGSLRGLGYSVMPMIVSLIGACGLRLLWIFTFSEWSSSILLHHCTLHIHGAGLLRSQHMLYAG